MLRAKRQCLADLRRNCIRNTIGRMAKDQRPPGQPVVGVLVAVDIPHAASLPAIEVQRVRTRAAAKSARYAACKRSLRALIPLERTTRLRANRMLSIHNHGDKVSPMLPALNRRTFLAGSASSALAFSQTSTPKRIAAIITEYRLNSHADVIVGKYL